MAALDAAQRIADELGLPRPQTLSGSADQSSRKILSLMNASGIRIMRRHDWCVLQQETTFLTVSGYDQGALSTHAADIDRRRIVADTMWNRTNNDQIIGPVTSEEWQDEMSGVSRSVSRRFYLRGNNIFLLPSPPAAETIAFEYISKNWVQNATGDGVALLAADTDIILIDEELLILDVCWRYNRAGGFPYEEQQQEFEGMLTQAIAVDRPARRLRLGMAPAYNPQNVRYPDTGWTTT